MRELDCLEHAKDRTQYAYVSNNAIIKNAPKFQKSTVFTTPSLQYTVAGVAPVRVYSSVDIHTALLQGTLHYTCVQVTITHVEIAVLQLLAVLKEVDGELGVLHPPRDGGLLPLPRPQDGQGAGGLELGLQPVLRVGVVVGHVDSQAAVLAEDDQGGAVLGALVGVGVCVWGGVWVCVCGGGCACMCVCVYACRGGGLGGR